jgi:hypothetical protein
MFLNVYYDIVNLGKRQAGKIFSNTGMVEYSMKYFRMQLYETIQIIFIKIEMLIHIVLQKYRLYNRIAQPQAI